MKDVTLTILPKDTGKDNFINFKNCPIATTIRRELKLTDKDIVHVATDITIYKRISILGIFRTHRKIEGRISDDVQVIVERLCKIRQYAPTKIVVQLDI